MIEYKKEISHPFYNILRMNDEYYNFKQLKPLLMNEQRILFKNCAKSNAFNLFINWLIMNNYQLTDIEKVVQKYKDKYNHNIFRTIAKFNQIKLVEFIYKRKTTEDSDYDSDDDDYKDNKNNKKNNNNNNNNKKKIIYWLLGW